MAPTYSLSTPTIGVPVKNAHGEEIGNLSEVVFDASTGQLRFAVIELKSDSTTFVAPWDAVTFQPGEPMSLNVTAEELTSAPLLNRPKEGSLVEARWHSKAETTANWPNPDELRLRCDGGPAPDFSRRPAGGRIALVVMAFALMAGLGWLVYSQGVEATTDRAYRAAVVTRRATVAFTEASKDATTTAKVKTAFALSKRVPALDVEVDTRHAVATLSGKVPTPETRQAAGEIAADTSGVRGVRNLLVVDSEESVESRP